MTTTKILAAIVFLNITLLSASQSTGDLPTANQHFNAGRYKEAADTYSALTIVSPDMAEAHVGLIRTRLVMDNLSGAAGAMRDALKVLPNSTAVLAAAGDVQFRLAHFQDSLALYQRALQLDQNLGRAW